jgi:hypothetical protein
MKATWRLLLLLAILSPFAVLTMFDLFIRNEPQPRPTASPRAVPFRICPPVRVEHVPEGLALKDSELRNLGGNVMGRSIQYTGGRQRVWVAVGFEVLDSLEDLDFTRESTRAVGGRTVTISTTDVLSGHRLRAGAWEDGRFETPCDRFTVVAWNLDRDAFLDVVNGVSVAPGT